MLPSQWQNKWSDLTQGLKTDWTADVHVDALVVAVIPPSNPVSLNKMLFWLNEWPVCFSFFKGNWFLGYLRFNRKVVVLESTTDCLEFY